MVLQACQQSKDQGLDQGWRTQDLRPGPRTQDPAWRTQDRGHRMQEPAWRTQNPGMWTGPWTEDRGLRTEQKR